MRRIIIHQPPALHLFNRLLLAVACAAICAPPSVARDYYVSPGGDDDGPGTQAAPFATIEAAIYDLVAGDTLYIGAGVYDEGEFWPDANATPANPITIRNVPGEQPIVDGGYTRWNFVELIELDGYVFEGLTLRNFYDIAISCRNTGYVTVRNCVLHANGSAGVALNYASYPHAAYDAHMLIEDNICYENGWGVGWASGIHVNNKGEGGDTAHVIRRNICYNNYDGSSYHTDGNGVMFDIGGGGECLIENNLCFNNGGAGIRAMDGRVDIVNNTCFRNGWDADNPYQPGEIELIERHVSGAVAGSTVRNNIVWSRAKRENDGAWYGGAFVAEEVPVGDFTFSHNVLWSDAPGEVVLDAWMADCVKANPQLRAVAFDDVLTTLHGATYINMNIADYDFALRSDSPAINAGLTSAAPDHDLRGEPRPRHLVADCGAYEYLGCGDCDDDGQTTPTDWVAGAPCMLGPAVLALTTCLCMDHDDDGDVDLADVAAQQTATEP